MDLLSCFLSPWCITIYVKYLGYLKKMVSAIYRSQLKLIHFSAVENKVNENLFNGIFHQIDLTNTIYLQKSSHVSLMCVYLQGDTEEHSHAIS
jgi:hypothetical protein